MKKTIPAQLCQLSVRCRLSIAARLSRLTMRLNLREWKLLLAGFCVCSVSASAYILTHPQTIMITRGPATIYAAPPSGAPLRSKKSLPVRVRRFRAYLDSLSATKEGRRTKDSLLRKNRGLIDSLYMVETIYQQ